MKEPSNTECQIFKILKEAEAGTLVPDLYRTYVMSNASLASAHIRFYENI